MSEFVKPMRIDIRVLFRVLPVFMVLSNCVLTVGSLLRKVVQPVTALMLLRQIRRKKQKNI